MADSSLQPAEEPQGEALVRSYFELLRTWQIPLTVETEGGVEAEGMLESIDPARHRMTLSISNAPSAGLEPDDAVKLYFGLEDSRWMGSALVQHYRDNRRSFVLSLPRKLEPRDRRKTPRFHRVEGLTVLSRVSEFSGAALHGTVLDLSEGGFLLRIDRATDALASSPLELEGDLIREGQDLAVVRISGFDEDLESEGRLIHMNRGKLGLLVGVRFRNLKQDGRALLEAYLRPRVQEAPAALPPLTFRSGVPEVDSGGGKGTEGADRGDALLRLKKRGRTLLVAMSPGAERDELQALLSGDGYGRVLVTWVLAELMEILQVLPVHGVLIDGGVSEMQGVELASFIHFAKGDQSCPILMAEYGNGAVLEQVSKQAGVDRLLGRPYAGPGLLSILEVELELRPREEVPELLTPLASDGRGRVLRRFRGVALVMPPGAEREAVGAFLTREGFTRVMPAGTIAELVRALESAALAVALIDWPEPDLMGLEIAHFLDTIRFEGRVRLLLAAAKPSPRIIEDARTLGVEHVLVKPYGLDSALADLLTSCLGE